ncbi:MAG: aspartate-semialdehyde dehydrogenase [Flavobacteriaceae bacterium]|nr:aspartate-semialdehyde dehydrogenase [Flavobacteriaceae bacterium]|tara:strand:+ start:1153 stop:2142 length:990 start_codon:yes stop_codon:yes gene_type:complete
MKIALIGVTGMVGNVMLKVLHERELPISELIPVASDKSLGKFIKYKNKEIKIVSLEESIRLKPNIALFSAGASISKEWAPKFKNIGTTVIDNSSAWRMNKKIKLIIPEINGNILSSKDKIIANPNCSTIQMLVALNPIHKLFKINRIVVSTYQSITGTGVKAVKQLENEFNNLDGEMAYPYQIHKNAIPHCDDFIENGYTKEEMKLVNETHKILNDYSIRISSTAVRIPVVGGHSESINISLENKTTVFEIKKVLKNSPGIVVQDDVSKNLYPMPLNSEGSDNVYVGRIRRDLFEENTFNLWVVSDNLRKGAATNTIQIAEYLINNFLI